MKEQEESNYPLEEPKMGFEKAFAEALLEERVRMVRATNLLRVILASLILLFFLAQAFLLERNEGFPDQRVAAVLTLLSTYVALAGAVWRFGGRTSRRAVASLLAVPFLDMPMVLARQWLNLSDVPILQLRHSLGYGLAIHLILVLLALPSLSRRYVGVAVAVSGLLQGIWIRRIDGGVEDWAWMVLSLGAGAMILTLTISRVRRLVEETSTEQLKRRRLGRFFSPQVIDALEGAGMDDLKSERREVTVLFGDLRNFTELSHELSDAEVVTLLKEHHTAMAEVVFEFGGTLDKFLGDGILAYFGAPTLQEDHAYRGVRCALSMQARVAERNGQRKHALTMGIGLHSGGVINGEIGPPNRREFTILGETVNVASRVEGLTKTLQQKILLTGITRELILQDPRGKEFVWERQAPSVIRGLNDPITTYAVTRKGG